MIQNTQNPKVLYFHGNGGNLTHLHDILETVYKLNLNILLFDYRGYGQSSGQITQEQDLYTDGLAAYNFLINHQQIPSHQIILWGQSLGGSVATQIAIHHSAHALILESTFSSIQKLAQDQYPFIPVKTLLRYPMRNDQKIQQVPLPLLIIHGNEDTYIPIQHAQTLYQLANEPKSQLIIPGDHAGLPLQTPIYLLSIKQFLNYQTL